MAGEWPVPVGIMALGLVGEGRGRGPPGAVVHEGRSLGSYQRWYIWVGYCFTGDTAGGIGITNVCTTNVGILQVSANVGSE